MDGTAWVWGEDPYGYLGDGADLERNIPILVAEDAGLSTAVAIATGWLHSLAIDASGQVWAWGENEDGQLGDGTSTLSNKPIKVAIDTGLTTAITIAAGQCHSLAIDDTGQVWAWGKNGSGQLGDGANTDSNKPVKVIGLANVVAIAAGEYHSVAIDNTGHVWAWGANWYGQLGDGTWDNQNRPVLVAMDTGLANVVKLTAGWNHSLVIDASGQAWAWGNNEAGQLGNETYTNQYKPVKVTVDTGLATVVAIAAGMEYSMAIDATSQLWAWGNNEYGQLGDGTTTGSNKPVKIAVNNGLTTVATITAGWDHSLAIDNTGQVWAWGSNSSGQLGDGTWDDKNRPVLVAGDNGFSAAVAIIAGGKHSLAIDINHKIWAWGNDVYGKLGDGNNHKRVKPISVTQSTGLIIAVAIAAGSGHNLAIDAVGQVWAWSNNRSGQLGDGTNIKRNKPVRVTVLTTVAAIAAGWDHSLAIDDTGQVWAWGDNWDGQLGDGTKNNQNKPVRVAVPTDITTFKAIAAGGSHSLAIDIEDKVWAWGRNDYGQLGDESNIERNQPVNIAVETTFLAIAAGANHSLAIDDKGQVWAWGDNWDGQLGDGTTDNQNKPVKVAVDTGLANVVAIAAGLYYSLAIDNTGQIWSWGENWNGQLGNGTTDIQNKPVKVAIDTGLANVAAIAAGWNHSLAIDDTGQVWAWGKNSEGQLGDGNIIDCHKPTLVAKDTGLAVASAVSGGAYRSLAVARIPKLAGSMTASPNPVLVGKNLAYQITITNAGSAPASNLILTDTLPTSVELASSSSGCDEANGIVICNLGILPAGTSTTVELIVKTQERGTITNSASVQCTEFPNPLVGTISTQVVSPEGFISVMIKRDWRKNPPGKCCYKITI